MAKLLSNDVLDAALTEVATCTTQTICSAQPANYAGIAAVALGSYTMTAGAGGGDYGSIADAAGGGREMQVEAQTGNNASASGDATHVALDDGVTLHAVTTCPTKTVTISEPFDISAWKITFPDPT